MLAIHDLVQSRLLVRQWSRYRGCSSAAVIAKRRSDITIQPADKLFDAGMLLLYRAELCYLDCHVTPAAQTIPTSSLPVEWVYNNPSECKNGNSG